MKFIADEDLTPRLATTCHENGYEATAVRDRGRRGSTDRALAEEFLDEGWIFITNNAGDYLREAEERGLHPGLIFMPLADIATEQGWMKGALDHIVRRAEEEEMSADDFMVNRVVVVDEAGDCDDYPWPPD